MPLYFVQDSDRPAHVIAKDFGHAIDKWKTAVAAENDCTEDEVGGPDGVSLVCFDNELIVDADFFGK